MASRAPAITKEFQVKLSRTEEPSLKKISEKLHPYFPLHLTYLHHLHHLVSWPPLSAREVGDYSFLAGQQWAQLKMEKMDT